MACFMELLLVIQVVC